VKSTRIFLLFCATLILSVGCSPLKNSGFEQYLSLNIEVPECVSETIYTQSTKIIGTASFYKRGINLVMQGPELKNMSIGDPLVSPLPIRYAEVAVYDSKNKLVQCGSTDAQGYLKALNGYSDLQIPKIPGSYSVRVLARSHIDLAAPISSPGKPTFKMRLSIKEDIYTQRVHYIVGSAYSNGVDDISNLNIKAFARQTDSLAIEGGAFNILNSIQIAYEFIQFNTGAVDTTCLNEKLNVFWKVGFNPRQYIEPEKNPGNLPNGSFYIKEQKTLYITGGKLGNMSIETANHFDDFVIMHEFAHFVEAQCGQLESPGGNHSIVVRVDPRLAWAEGWANYFAAQVMNDAMTLVPNPINPELPTKLSVAGLPTAWTYLFGSKGFSDSFQNIGNGSGFMFDLKKPGNNPDTWQFGSFLGFPFDKVDPNRFPGEGHFREGAVTRGLFKLTNNCGGSCITTTPIPFVNVWQSMDKLSGAGQSMYTFKDSHRVMEFLKAITIAAGGVWPTYKNFNQLQTSEALHLFSDGIFTTGAGPTAVNRWQPYGTILQNQVFGACPNGQNYIEPRSDDPVLTGSNSDQRYANQFFTFDPAILSGVTELTFSFLKQNGSGTNTEFDILLYPADYFHTLDYACSNLDENGNCKSTWQPSRSTASDVLRSDRRTGPIYTKVIKKLNELDRTKKYLINVRAYTAGKSISSVTDYSFTIIDQNGISICP
jgi:hypothetical protein